MRTKSYDTRIGLNILGGIIMFDQIFQQQLNDQMMQQQMLQDQLMQQQMLQNQQQQFLLQQQQEEQQRFDEECRRIEAEIAATRAAIINSDPEFFGIK